jgi:hypothetical protein
MLYNLRLISFFILINFFVVYELSTLHSFDSEAKDGKILSSLPSSAVTAVTTRENAITYAILFTAEAKYDVLQTVSKLKQQGVQTSQIHLFLGQYEPSPNIDFENLHVAPLFINPVFGNDYEPVVTKVYAWLFSHEAIATSEWVVLLEDDLDISPDFVPYMEWGKQIMEKDESVFSVSAWNDNAASGFTLDPEIFFMCDNFMGLGWLFRAKSFRREIIEVRPSKDTTQDEGSNCNFESFSFDYNTTKSLNSAI